MSEVMTTPRIYPPISLASRWHAIFDRSMPVDIRRQRWAAWLTQCRQLGHREIAIGWARNHECHGCRHRRGGWCELQALPCTVNPILTIRHGMSGMACAGAGRELIEPSQLELAL